MYAVTLDQVNDIAFTSLGVILFLMIAGTFWRLWRPEGRKDRLIGKLVSVYSIDSSVPGRSAVTVGKLLSFDHKGALVQRMTDPSSGQMVMIPREKVTQITSGDA